MFKRLFGKKTDAEPRPEARDDEGFSVDLVHIGGTPELEHLFISPSVEDVHRALDGWKWIGLTGLRAIAVSAFGEVFFQSADDTVLHLDTLEGRLSPVSRDLPEFIAKLLEAEHRDALLLGGLVMSARSRGMPLPPGHCYDFKLPPALGGAMDVDQIRTQLFVVKLDLAGQLHEQVKDLPPGTPIDKITISD
jgi:hypothetical protein